ncbi:MAG: exodeoxyribonuclease V subunit beta [Sedimenticola sp.]|nr:exodeoxyribonuclease V subunit beta [Sedimenticola sp.]
MQPLSLFETTLDGMHLIEASAGTGKTYTITGLYLRLVMERGLSVDQILVVTFTKAATAELRERIRSSMVDLKKAWEQGREHPFAEALLNGREDAGERLKRLSLAILDFDRAAVFTIHGFCQRLLADSAFESGVAFESELVADQQSLLQEVVDDFWRKRVQDLSPGLLGYLLDSGFAPDRLSGTLNGHINQPYLEIRALPMPGDLEELESEFQQAIAAARVAWDAGREEVIRLLRESEGLNRKRYRQDWIEGWLAGLEQYLQAPEEGPFPQLEKFTSGYIKQSLKKDRLAPEHPFFDCCEALLVAGELREQAYRQARVALIGELIAFSNRQLPQRKREQRLQSYDDLLLNLHSALQGSHGDQLVALVRRDYGAALIDEFQDTDPVQYAIFRQLFMHAGCTLFLVGDPKQAIYSFRGADIFAYLKARNDAVEEHTLDRNWRSLPQLVKTVNRLFGATQRSFLFPQIPFHPTRAAERSHQQLLDGEGGDACFRIGFIAGKQSKDQATASAARWTAREIARLLGGADEARVYLDDRPLAGGDIAVLVRTHRQGQAMQAALQAHGIHSVQHAQQDVFQSQDAEELERLLYAVREPQREDLVFAVLAGKLVAIPGEQIANLADDEVRIAHYLEQFQDLHEVWLQHGFMRMFRLFLQRQQVAPRLLGSTGGERSLTNLLHLSELLHQQERESVPGMGPLIAWLGQMRRGADARDEQRQQRLESDEALVQIVTIHRSKGLQYPLVFCPFVWDGGVRGIGSGEGCRFHDPEQGYRTVLDLGSEQWDVARVRARNEALAESLRLLYVALTRAEQRCYITWGNVNGAGESPLAWLLHPPEEIREGDLLLQMSGHFKSLHETDLRTRLQQWADKGEGQVLITDCQAESTETPFTIPGMALRGGDQVTGPSLQAKSFSRRLRRRAAVTSFSALTSGHDRFDRPDHDGEIALPATGMTETAPDLDRFGFPRGANPGSCLHAIFEQLDFRNHALSDLQTLVATELKRFGIDEQWREVACGMVSDVLRTPLDIETGHCLGQVGRDQCLVEMGFYYPLRQLRAERLRQLLKQHGFVAGSESMEQAVRQLGFRDVEGYMRGFIDLVFVDRGRYYLVDYKSNWLGDRQEAYDRSGLQAAVAGNGYYLQYLLYSVALHRYLARRLPDYHYERHFGAVYYLFLRGMSPATGPEYGVFRDRPRFQLVQALDDYFSGVEGG